MYLEKTYVLPITGIILKSYSPLPNDNPYLHNNDNSNLKNIDDKVEYNKQSFMSTGIHLH
jgi:hypothetical protein